MQATLPGVVRLSDFQIFGLSDFYGNLLDPTRPYWTLLDATGPYWTLLDLTGPYWTLLDILLAVPTVVGENILEVCVAYDNRKTRKNTKNTKKTKCVSNDRSGQCDQNAYWTIKNGAILEG